MKFTLPSLLAVAVLAGLVYDPKPAFAQSKEMIALGELQRQNYSLEHKLDELKTAQDGRTAQMEALLKQVMEANGKLSGELHALQESVRSNQLEQQRRVFDPMAAVKVGVEDISGSVLGVDAKVEAMRKRQEAMEKSLYDLTAMVKVMMQTPAPTPAVEPVSTGPSAADAASLLFASAQRDRMIDKHNEALQSFFDLSQNYPTSPEAPLAVYAMGEIYAGNEEYEQALKAFDRVLEQFPDNPMRKDAQFQKAEQLASLGRKSDAVKEFNSFAKQYPGDPNATRAIERARELLAPAASKAKPPAKGKSK